MPVHDLPTLLAVAAGSPARPAGLTESDRVDALGAIVGAASVVSPDVLGCSLTEVDGLRLITSVSSGPMAVELDAVQYAVGSGPCVTAARDGRQTILDITASVGRFADAARERGVQSVLSIPLTGTQRPSGMNLYGGRADAFPTPTHVDRATLLGRILSTVMTGVSPDSAEVRRPDEAARRRRVFVDARERVMQDHGLDEQAAFYWLVGMAREQGRSIFALAQDVVDGGSQ